MPKLTKTTEAQIIAGCREVRAMEPDRIASYVVGPMAQRKAALAFLLWCEKTGARFGQRNIGEVFGRFQAEVAA